MFVLSCALAAACVGAFAWAPSAQPVAILEACEGDEARIRAADLPATSLRLEECPTRGRTIVDGQVGSVVPPPGKSVHAEVLTLSGAQELEVSHLPDGTLELGHVGDDAGDAGSPALEGARASSPGECSDSAYKDGERRVASTLTYRYNRSTTPSRLTEKAAVTALRRGGGNVHTTENTCGMGDRVPVGVTYGGDTRERTDIDAGAYCGSDDGKSVVVFGDLPSGILAATCNWGVVKPGHDNLTASDVKFRAAVQWTTSPGARSCTGAYDVEGVMTHERGHTFGLGHVSETYHRNLTMSTNLNGPCQSSERTLGRGDVLGLDNKYP